MTGFTSSAIIYLARHPSELPFRTSTTSPRICRFAADMVLTRAMTLAESQITHDVIDTSANAIIDHGAVDLTWTFTLFPEFPIEFQSKIFEAALPDEGDRIIRIFTIKLTLGPMLTTVHNSESPSKSVKVTEVERSDTITASSMANQRLPWTCLDRHLHARR